MSGGEPFSAHADWLTTLVTTSRKTAFRIKQVI
jgi:hypothetical protein